MEARTDSPGLAERVPMTTVERIALYGPLLLALYFVAVGRWGSFLLPGPPYIGDLVLGGLIAHRVWLLLRGQAPATLIARYVGITTGLLLAYSLVWLAAGDYTIDALRDAAPYLYAILVFFGQSYRRLRPEVVERLVYGVLIFHAAWYTLALFVPSVISIPTLGDSSVKFFEIRSDFDGAMVGVLAALALDRTITGKTPLLSAAVGSWALTMVLYNQSRASLGATLAALGLIALRYLILRRSGKPITLPSAGSDYARRVWLNPALAVAAIVLAPIIVTVDSGSPGAINRTANVLNRDRLDRAERNSEARARAERNSEARARAERNSEARARAERNSEARALVDTGEGTFRARLAGWEETIDWIIEEPSRIAVGVGFGPHYMQLSGADVAFLGELPDPTVRAIHNYGLNTWARLGIVGLILVGILTGLALVAAVWLISRAASVPLLDLFAAMLVLTIPATAMLGVILESPFGAIPFFWAIGYLSARMVEEGRWRRLPLPARLSPSPRS